MVTRRRQPAKRKEDKGGRIETLWSGDGIKENTSVRWETTEFFFVVFRSTLGRLHGKNFHKRVDRGKLWQTDEA